MTRLGFTVLAALALVGCNVDSAAFTGPVATRYDFGDLERYEELTLSAPNGDAIAAVFVNGDSDLSVLYFHGASENLTDIAPRLAYFQRRGFSVLAIDYRGFGKSEGSSSERNAYQDAEVALAALSERGTSPAQTVIMGRSFGGAIATHAAIREPPKSLVLESTIASAALAVSSTTYFDIPASFTTEGEWDNVARIRAMEAFPKALLHGDADETFPFWHAERLFEEAADPASLFRVEGAGHVGIFEDHEDVFRAALCHGLEDDERARCER